MVAARRTKPSGRSLSPKVETRSRGRAPVELARCSAIRSFGRGPKCRPRVFQWARPPTRAECRARRRPSASRLSVTAPSTPVFCESTTFPLSSPSAVPPAGRRGACSRPIALNQRATQRPAIGNRRRRQIDACSGSSST